MALKTNFFKREIPFSNQPVNRGWQIAGVLLVLSILLGICMMVLTTINCDFVLVGVLVLDLRIFFLNVLPLFCLMAILYFFTNTMWFSFFTTGIAAFIIAEVNRFKMVFRDDPLIFEDVLLMSEAKEMTENYMLYLDAVSFCVLMCIMLITVYCFFKIRPKVKRSLARIGGVFCAVVLLVTSCQVFYFGNEKLHENLWHPVFGDEYKAGNQAMSRGVVYSFVKSIPEAFISPPAEYDENEIRMFMRNYKDVDMPEEKRVHMISIMLEAYNDFSKFDGVEFANDPYKFYHEIEADGYCGDLYTNIFAASTIYTERQYLTGYSNMQFQKKAVPSYVWYLKSQGYSVDAMHPCVGWFYNRKNMNQYFGFEGFDHHENKYGVIPDSELRAPRYHEYISDLDFFDFIKEGFEKAVEKNEKYFNFSVTYQNHGPYVSYDAADMEYLLRKDEYTEDEYYSINNYFDGIYKTDIALKELRDYIDSRSEPIVLTLFGDHNPHLGGDNEGYKMLGIDLGMETAKGAENYYATRYVFYANDAAKKALGKSFVGEGPTISPMFLMNEYFSYAGMEGPAYLNYLTELRKEYDVLNPVYVAKDGVYTKRSELQDVSSIEQFRRVEYYMKNSGVVN